MSALTDAANGLVSEVAEVVAEIHSQADANAALAARIAELLASGNAEEAAAVAAQLVQATTDLKAAVESVHPAAPVA